MKNKKAQLGFLHIVVIVLSALLALSIILFAATIEGLKREACGNFGGVVSSSDNICAKDGLSYKLVNMNPQGFFPEYEVTKFATEEIEDNVIRLK